MCERHALRHDLPHYGVDLPLVQACLAILVEEVCDAAVDKVRIALIWLQPTDFEDEVGGALPRSGQDIAEVVCMLLKSAGPYLHL